MSSFEDIQQARVKKLELLREAFGDVYPARSLRTHAISDIVGSFARLLRGKKSIVISGRVRALRPHGGSTFFDLEENGAIIQAFMRKEDSDEKLYATFLEAIDIGDFVELTGRAYLTQRKEKSLLVSSWRPLAKAVRPLPDKWHGLQDVEERYRTRAIDLLSNTRVRDIFITRARALSFIRSYFEKQNFIEVETPTLQPIPGGATARPFATHHNALDIDLYLRVSPELYLKRLVVGGLDRVFEIARNFRNEGIDVTHNPEFTMLEAYVAYGDYESLMKSVEQLLQKLFSAILKKKEFAYNDKQIAIGKSFRRITFYDTLKQYALLPQIETMSQSDLEIAAKRFGINTDQPTRSGLTEDIFRKAVRPHLIQPTFVIDWPRELLPLAKRSSKDPNLAEAFQLYIGGIELVKGFSELNDPADQRTRFQEQEKLRERGDEEAQRIDEDFIQNLEYGMPPTAGFGIGFDRLMLLLTDNHNLREVILFPTLRPKKHE